VAELDKLLLYTEGGHFAPHRDSEKSDDMLGTLVVLLPSEHTGGTLTVEHQGDKRALLYEGPEQLSLFAFYADCCHWVDPVHSGLRATLTYRLRRRKRAGAKARAPGGSEARHARAVAQLSVAMQRFFSTRRRARRWELDDEPPRRLVYLLDHPYTQSGLGWHSLKSPDQLRVDTLRAATRAIDGECHLALAQVHEVWNVVEPGGSRYRHWSDEVDVDALETDYIVADDVCLDHWIDERDSPREGMRTNVWNYEILHTRPSAELPPDRQEYEGYQGNYGNTLERWYRRAAFVVWPRSHSLALRAESHPAEVAKELFELRRSDARELHARLALLAPKWAYWSRGRVDAELGEATLRLAAATSDRSIAKQLSDALGLDALEHAAVRVALAELVARHGLSFAVDLWASLSDPRKRAPRASVLVALAETLVDHGDAACVAWLGWIVDELATSTIASLNAHPRRPRWLDLEGSPAETERVVELLHAASIDPRPDTARALLAKLLATPRARGLDFLLPAFSACFAAPPLRDLATELMLGPVLERLGAILALPTRAADDWRTDFELGCSCQLCAQLGAWLRSNDRALDWPLSKERRQHVHHVIDASGLPLSHETRRGTSPCVIMLRKLPELHARAVSSCSPRSARSRPAARQECAAGARAERARGERQRLWPVPRVEAAQGGHNPGRWQRAAAV
jgi:hypothetical protein